MRDACELIVSAEDTGHDQGKEGGRGLSHTFSKLLTSQRSVVQDFEVLGHLKQLFVSY